MKSKNIAGILFAVLVVSSSVMSQVRLPRLISDGMVLQRDADVRIWGWASKGEKVSVRFVGSSSTTTASDNGEWSVVLAKQRAGGPYQMQIIASNSVTISDVMIGDVWVCSGQSNMELSMTRAQPLYGREIAESTNPSIRQFLVPQRYNFKQPQKDVESGIWKSADPQTVLEFSAVAYFFAKELFNRYHVPIGLINTSLGGSPAEAWMSEEALRSFPAYYSEAQRFKNDQLIQQIDSQDNARIRAWYDLLQKKDEGVRDLKGMWSDPSYDASAWESMTIPGYWASTSLGPVNGVVWFRRSFEVSSSAAGKGARLNLGRIVDADSVFVNGAFVGWTSYQYPPRRYEIPANLLKEGKNTIVVRVINSAGKGGFVVDKPYEIDFGSEKIDLKGKWQFHLGATMDPLASQTFIRWKPVGLYNAMLAPLLNYRMKGAVWYQGESNAGRAMEYRELLPALIRNWRNDWKQGDFPFLFVQLPNFMEPRDKPSESGWALLRESQLKTLALPNTAMAVAIDIGEWNDIHPLNKKDIGVRLAIAAGGVAYRDKRLVYSGPLYQSMKVEGSKIVVTLTNTGSGLVTKGGELKQFAIAGADKQFAWANAKIEKNRVIVWSDTILKPVAVRYAWAANPAGSNLYNKEGLPASPFRTDDWITQ
jgi:sialate O-acetylesterase